MIRLHAFAPGDVKLRFHVNASRALAALTGDKPQDCR
jgi:hypothetical protein